MSPTRPLAAAVLALLLSSGCAPIASVTRPATRAVGRVLLSTEEERRIGAQLAAQVRQQERVLDDPRVQSYVRRLGQRIVDQVPREDRRFDFQFTVLDAPDDVNAFALPGGHIFVNSGLIRAADSEAELAAVLAHEVAHVTADHPSNQLAAQVGLGTLQQLALGQDPGLAAQIGSTIAAQGYLAAHSREQEREADRRGLEYLARANYEPAAMARFFEKLARMSRTRPALVGDFLASHPAPGQRAETISSLIRERGYGGGRQSILGGFERIQAQI
jgi:beta-barrel assembly-enhancing protease